MNAPRIAGAIGGYFELELPRGTGELYPTALKYQSARAAFASLLQHARPRKVWMPWYNCDTMLEAPEIAKVAVQRYGLDSDLFPEGLDALAADDWLLYVNYFGVCDRQVSGYSRRFRASGWLSITRRLFTARRQTVQERSTRPGNSSAYRMAATL